MKRTLRIAGLIILILSSFFIYRRMVHYKYKAFAQIATQPTPMTFTFSTQTPIVIPVFTSNSQFWQITWTITGGSFSACTVQVDSSLNGTSGWGAADVIGAQTCTSNGVFLSSTATIKNYIRVNVNNSLTVNTGTPTLNVLVTGYYVYPVGLATLFGTPNGVSLSGSTTLFVGADECAAIKAATAASIGGIANASGFTGTQVCAGANVTNMIASTFSGQILLGCPLIMYVPLQSSGAANIGGDGDPLQGTIIMSPRTILKGCSMAGTSGTVNVSTIKACPAAGGPAACTSGGNAGYVPATHNFAVSAVSLTTAAGNRTYMTATIAGGDIVGAEPLRFANYQNVSLNSFPVRVCQQTQANGPRNNGGSPSRVDGSCPIALPTATSVAFPVNSGVWGVASIGGTNTGYSGAIRWTTGTSGGCLYPASGTATQSAGSINAVFIQNRGRGCTSAPTATPFGASGGSNATITFTIATPCAGPNCGVLHASVPLLETGPFPTTNAFNQRVESLVLDCSNLPDCVNFRTLTMNEGSTVKNVLATNAIERCYDAHTFIVQNSDSWDGDQCTSGSSPANDPGVVPMFIAETGPHGIKDFTANYSNATNSPLACIVMDGDFNFTYFMGGHCENTLYSILVGADSPARGFTVQNWLGAPQGVSFCASGCTNTNVGPYQNENQTVVKVRSEYFTNTAPVATVTTSDYAFANIIRNTASAGAGTIADDNPVNNSTISANLFFTDNGYWITDLITERYEVDQTASGAEIVSTTATDGSYSQVGEAYSCAVGGGPAIYFNQNGSAATVTTLTQNKITLWRIVLPCNITAGHIGIIVGAADATGTNLYDIGLYGPSCLQNLLCNLLVDTGAQTGTTLGFTTTGAKNLAFAQGNTAIPAGNYLLAMTTNSTTPAGILGGTQQIGLLNANVALTSAGGALTTPNIIAPANSIGTSSVPEYLLQP